MKRIRIDIRTENDAFDYGPEQEIARILDALSSNLKNATTHYDIPRSVQDSNGNTVGSVKID